MPDAALYRLAYPLPYRETIRFESDAHDIDPALVAALIRQESSFFPLATSAVGARGLMQIMPAVGRQSAIAQSAVAWSDALDRWTRKPGASDEEVFVERIPYVETRDYVRIVLRNMTWYRRLYAL